MPDLSVWPTDGADGSVSTELRWRKMARLWVPSGVVPTGLVPALIAGPAITVTVGAAWIDGHYAELVTPATVPVTANGLLVVRFTPADNRAELLWRDGATVPTQTDPTWELPIAKMTAGAITDLRMYMPPGGIPWVAALPPFPYDGQTVFYYHAVSGRGWTMTYLASAPAPYRWVVVGGPEMIAYVGNNENQAPAAGFFDLPTPGPDITLPLAGIYDIRLGFHSNNSGAGSVQSMNPYAMPSLALPGAAFATNPGAAAAAQFTVVSPIIANTITNPGQVIRAKYSTSGAAGYYGQRWMTARPIRVA